MQNINPDETNKETMTANPISCSSCCRFSRPGGKCEHCSAPLRSVDQANQDAAMANLFIVYTINKLKLKKKGTPC